MSAYSRRCILFFEILQNPLDHDGAKLNKLNEIDGMVGVVSLRVSIF